jgi:hypothetical protein
MLHNYHMQIGFEGEIADCSLKRWSISMFSMIGPRAWQNVTAPGIFQVATML